MNSKCIYLVLMLGSLAAMSSAQVSLVSSAFTGEDSIVWSTLGEPGTLTSSVTNGLTTDSNAFTVSQSGNGELLQQESLSTSNPYPWGGNFDAGDVVYYNLDTGAANEDKGPLTISGLDTSEVGAYVNVGVYGSYTMTLSAYNGTNLLGTVSEVATTSFDPGAADFLGISSSTNITSIVFSQTGELSINNDFAIDNLQIASANAAPTPEPFTMTLAAAGVGLAARRKVDSKKA